MSQDLDQHSQKMVGSGSANNVCGFEKLVLEHSKEQTGGLQLVILNPQEPFLKDTTGEVPYLCTQGCGAE